MTAPTATRSIKALRLVNRYPLIHGLLTVGPLKRDRLLLSNCNRKLFTTIYGQYRQQKFEARRQSPNSIRPERSILQMHHNRLRVGLPPQQFIGAILAME